MNDSSSSSAPSAPFDTWAVLDFWLRRWRWLACWTLLFAAGGVMLARYAWSRSYTASAQLIHYAPSAADDSYRPRDIAAPSLVLMLQSPSLFETLAPLQEPPVSPLLLARRLQFTLDRNNDIATIVSTGSDRERTVDLVNQFAAIAIEYTQALQKQEAVAAAASVRRQIREVEAELAASRAAVPAGSASVVAALSDVEEVESAAPASEFSERRQAAHDKLDELLVSYTDAHPLVNEQRARVASLDASALRIKTAKPATKSRRLPSAALSAATERATPEEIAMGERLRTFESSRIALVTRERAIQPFISEAPGYFRVLTPATPGRTLERGHRLEMGLCGVLGAFFGLFLAAGQVLLSEFMDNRVKTRADVRRVTGLPLLATLGDLNTMSDAERDEWAFRAWTALQSRLSLSANHGMVCGITSAHSGDGRSTWIGLLSRAASACGFRVLTITAQPSPAIAADLARREKSSGPAKPVPTSEAVALNTNVLTMPGQLAERLSGADSPPTVNIPLPGWAWNLERRKQWHSALEVWRAIENVVIFVELPPASVSETVLLAENVPNLLWLVDSNKSDAAETHTALETLRHARCNLVGAVLNRERAMPIRGRFTRWFGSTALLLALGLSVSLGLPRAQAAEPVSPAPAGAASRNFTNGKPAQRSDWQKRLTLGPGDVLNFHLFGAPELTREEVPVGPDGRISFLEAEDVLATGLTVDELRAKLDEELGKFRRAPQAYVTPVAYRSKKYYVMGSVVQKGVFPLDRSLTVIEAVARARGFQTGVVGDSTADNTDFSRSFVGRRGARLPVDLQKLFLEGDLSHNVALEPDDYIFFAAGTGGQVYVLGEVTSPGAAPTEGGSNVLSVIAARGGFTDRAWTQHVLVVRGSLDRPETFKVDIKGALSGKAPNLALQAGDLVFVSHRPWIRAEELLDSAASAFVEAAVITWTGLNVSP